MERIVGALPKIIVIVFVIFIFVIRWRLGYFKHIPAYISKISWKFLFLIFIAAVFSIALCAAYADQKLLDWVALNRDSLTWIANIGAALGRGINPWFFLSILYIGALATHRTLFAQTIISGFLSAAFASLLSFTCKFTLLRARPYTDHGPFSFFNLEGLTKDARAFQSFTSGDVAVVAGIAFYFALKTKQRGLKSILFAVPLLTALARVYANKHWPSDTLAAALMSFFAAYHVMNYEKETRRENNL